MAVPRSITIEEVVGGVSKVKADQRASVQELSEQCRPGGMVGVGVCIPSYVDRDFRVSSLDVFYDEGEGSQSYEPLMLLPSSRQVDSNVGGWGLPRDVKNRRENRLGKWLEALLHRGPGWHST